MEGSDVMYTGLPRRGVRLSCNEGGVVVMQTDYKKEGAMQVGGVMHFGKGKEGGTS